MRNPWTRKITQKRERTLQKKIEFTNWIVLGIFLLLSGVLASLNFTLGILAGGLISILNFHGLCKGLQSAFSEREGSPPLAKAPFIIKYLLRLAATGLVLYIILVHTRANIFGLVIGISTVIISIVLTVIMAFFDKSYLEEV